MATILPMIGLELTRPGLAALAVGLLPIVWYYRRSLVDFARWQRRASLAVRIALVVALVLAAAGLSWVHHDGRRFVVFLLDRSDSIDPTAQAQAEAFLAEAARHKADRDEIRVIEFAGQALAPRAVDGAKATPDELDPSRTDLAGAIFAGWAAVPASYAGHLVVLSDGRATGGDAADMARLARQAGLRVSAVPLAAGASDEVRIARVTAPDPVWTGAPFELAIEIESNHAETARVEVLRDGRPIAEQAVELGPGTTTLRLPLVAAAEPVQSYIVQLRPVRDRFPQSNTAGVRVACQGKPRVLLIESSPRDGRHLAAALAGQDILVEVRTPRGAPRTLTDIETFDLVCLVNVPATDLASEQMRLIRSYVQDRGGGLIVIGGEKAFGPGGYYKTVLEEVLPVLSDFEKPHERPSLAMVLVLDSSGSMAGQKIELARHAARAAVELLGPRDQVGVIAFNAAATWLCPLHPAEDRDYVFGRIAALTAGGGTNLAPALAGAGRALAPSRAGLKHVIVLTDGISQPGSFYDTVRSLADSQVTVSTVAVGPQADRTLLERIASWGGGRSYFTDNPSQVPQIFARETVEASRSAIHEEPFVPRQVKPHAICQGIPFEEAPLLLGRVLTRARPSAELLLASEAGEPLLATWHCGLGKSLAFTSDATDRWAADWLAWDGFARFWAQAVRDSMRPAAASALMDVRFDRAGDIVHVTVEALDPAPHRSGQYIEGVRTILEIIAPGGDKQDVWLEPVAPGRWATVFPAQDLAGGHVRIVQKRGEVEVQSIRRGLSIDYPNEYRAAGPDDTALRRIAEAGGGAYDPAPAETFSPQAGVPRCEPLARPLLMAALVLLVLDVALRRIDLSRSPATPAAPAAAERMTAVPTQLR